MTDTKTPTDIKEGSIRCDICGKEIPVGAKYYKQSGIYYRCCSTACMLYALEPNVNVLVNNGEGED